MTGGHFRVKKTAGIAIPVALSEKKKEKQEMRKSVKMYMYLFLLLCIVGVGLPAWQAQAAEGEPVLKEIEANGADSLVFSAELSESWGEVNIYRAEADPAAGGQWQLADSFDSYGNTWSSNGGYWQTTGKKEKMTCVAEDSAMEGEVYFIDSGLELGKTYYYRISIENFDDEVLYSNVVSGETMLSTPEILKGYAASNTSAKLSWQKVSKAQKYIIYRKSGKKWVKVKTLKKAKTYTDKGLKSGKTYSYKIRALHKSGGRKSYSAYSSVIRISTKTPKVKGNYKSGSVYGPSLSTSKLLEVRRVVQSFKDNYISKEMSDYEKVLSAFNFIRANCGYAWRGWQYNNANTAWGALVYGEAQCSGFARGMKTLCDGIGVPCYYVHANSRASNPSHQWNFVKVGGKWYVLDAQSGVFLVSGKTFQNSFGMRWNTKGLPSVSKTDHPKGGFAASVMGE